MHKVLITGACGFLGRHCLGRLTASGSEIHVVTRRKTILEHAQVCVHRADLLDPAQVAALLAEVRPSHLLHLAWVTTPGIYWTSSENLAWVGASLCLLREFVEHGGHRVVIAGSCAEYDWSAGRCSETDTALKPASLYGACKDALRAVVEVFARQVGLSAAWGRVFFLYGPHQDSRRLVAKVIQALLAGEPAGCSAGTQRRDFLHVQDAADALVALLHSNLEGPVNIASGRAVSIRSVVKHLAALTNRPDLVRLGAVPAGLNDAPLLAADVRRLRDELRWCPRFSLNEGLAHTVDWWRSRIRGSPLAA